MIGVGVLVGAFYAAVAFFGSRNYLLYLVRVSFQFDHNSKIPDGEAFDADYMKASGHRII